MAVLLAKITMKIPSLSGDDVVEPAQRFRIIPKKRARETETLAEDKVTRI